MRLKALLPLVALAGALSACASGGMQAESYSAKTDRLSSECEARGGILVPTGDQTGRPETDNACRITNASRLNTGH